MPTKITMPRITLPVKRVRFDPFVTYLGEEPPEDLDETSMHMDAVSGRRSSNGGNKRRSLDLHEMFSSDKGTGGMGDGSSLGFGSFGGSFGSFANSSDAGMAFLQDSIAEEEDEDFTENSSSHDPDAAHKKFAQADFLDFEKSDSSFPDLGPLNLEDETGLKGSGNEVKLSVGRATLTA